MRKPGSENLSNLPKNSLQVKDSHFCLFQNPCFIQRVGTAWESHAERTRNLIPCLTGREKPSLFCSFKCMRVENMKYSPWLCFTGRSGCHKLRQEPSDIYAPSQLPSLPFFPSSPPFPNNNHKEKEAIKSHLHPSHTQMHTLGPFGGVGVLLWGEREQSEGRRAERWNQSSLNHWTWCFASLQQILPSTKSSHLTQQRWNITMALKELQRRSLFLSEGSLFESRARRQDRYFTLPSEWLQRMKRWWF